MTQRKRFLVRTRTIDEAVADLPVLRAFDGAMDPIDIYILASGFEKRVLGVPIALQRAGVTVLGPILLGRYRTNPEDNARREAELTPILKALNGRAPETFDADNPESTHRAISEALANSERSLHVALDISGASSTLIFSALATLLHTRRPLRLTVLYAAAAKYHEPEMAARDEPAIKWGESDLRETGVSEVDQNELYPGFHHDNLPNYVIALPSMFSARLQRCLGHLGVGPMSGADDSVFWILPSTDSEQHRWRQAAVEQALLDVIHGVEADAITDDEVESETEVSTPTDTRRLPAGSFSHCDVSDYQGCLRLVLEQIDANAGSNLSIIHMGTKLQAVGVALALAARQEVSLVSARPQAFAASTYSDGVGQMLSLTFENPQQIVKRLTQVGALDVGAP